MDVADTFRRATRGSWAGRLSPGPGFPTRRGPALVNRRKESLEHRRYPTRASIIACRREHTEAEGSRVRNSPVTTGSIEEMSTGWG